jgi:hypothetical protein
MNCPLERDDNHEAADASSLAQKARRSHDTTTASTIFMAIGPTIGMTLGRTSLSGLEAKRRRKLRHAAYRRPNKRLRQFEPVDRKPPRDPLPPEANVTMSNRAIAPIAALIIAAIPTPS